KALESFFSSVGLVTELGSGQAGRGGGRYRLSTDCSARVNGEGFDSACMAVIPIQTCIQGRRANQLARMAPEMLCQTLNIALGTAANGEKCALAKAAPRPLFCMPTSMLMAFRFAMDRPNAFAE